LLKEHLFVCAEFLREEKEIPMLNKNLEKGGGEDFPPGEISGQLVCAS